MCDKLLLLVGEGHIRAIILELKGLIDHVCSNFGTQLEETEIGIWELIISPLNKKTFDDDESRQNFVENQIRLATAYIYRVAMECLWDNLYVLIYQLGVGSNVNHLHLETMCETMRKRCLMPPIYNADFNSMVDVEFDHPDKIAHHFSQESLVSMFDGCKSLDEGLSRILRPLVPPKDV